MAEERLLCVDDAEVVATISAACGCCCETATAFFDAGNEYVFDVGRHDGDIISASYDWQCNKFDVPVDVMRAKFQPVKEEE